MQSQDRLEWLDSLRGLSALLVMLFHLWLTAYRQFPALGDSSFAGFTDLLVRNAFDIGKIGIVVFFAISGFVIPQSILKHTAHRVERFAVNRFFRLYPLFWVSVALAVFVSAETVPPSQVIANLSMVAPLFGHADLSGVYWTLQIELFFYFLCGALVVAGMLDSIQVRYLSIFAWLLIALFFSCLRYWLDRKVPVAVPLALSIMFLGSYWRDHLAAGRASRGRLICAVGAFVATLLPICLLAYQRDFGNQENWSRYFLSWTLGLTIFLVLTARTRLHQRVLVNLGTISYSIYLLHPLVGIPIVRAFAKHDSDSLPIAWGSIVLACTASLFAAAVAYRFIEAPGIRLGKSISGRLLANSRHLDPDKRAEPTAG